MKAKQILRWTWLPVIVVCVYVAITMGMRGRENRMLEEKALQADAEADRKIVDQYGNGELKLMTFYASPPQVSAGGKSLLCYGVANANSVTIEPAVPGVGPSLSRCVEVRPTKTTTYTITASGAATVQVSKTVTVEVR